MKLIKPSWEIWEQPTGLEGIYKQIETKYFAKYLLT